MKLEKLLRSKILCLSIMLCLFSWALYFYSSGNLKIPHILLAIPSYSIDIIYMLGNTSIYTFSSVNADFAHIEMIAFILSLLICITAGLIISTFLHILIKKLLSIQSH